MLIKWDVFTPISLLKSVEDSTTVIQMEEGPLTGTSSMAGLTTAQEQSPGTNGHKVLLLGCTTSPKEHESNCSLLLLSKIICPHMVKKEKNHSTMKESTEESRSQMFDYSDLINSRLYQMKSYEC